MLVRVLGYWKIVWRGELLRYFSKSKLILEHLHYYSPDTFIQHFGHPNFVWSCSSHLGSPLLLFFVYEQARHLVAEIWFRHLLINACDSWRYVDSNRHALVDSFWVTNLRQRFAVHSVHAYRLSTFVLDAVSVFFVVSALVCWTIHFGWQNDQYLHPLEG